jgi:FkbM family methyltransferase
MTHLFLHNSFHYGDVILTRALIQAIRNSFSGVKITLECVESCAYLWQDLKLPISLYQGKEYQGTEPTPNCPVDAIFVNMWFGVFDDILSLYGMTYQNNVHTFNRQMYQHNLNHQYLLPIPIYTPMITFFGQPEKEIQVKKNSILVENGEVFSNQSYFYLNEHLKQIATDFPQLNFYCSSQPKFPAANIFDCSEMNLKELSQVGDKCIGLLMKGSAVNAASQTEVNRYKPRCIVGWDLPVKLWDNLENPVVYAKNYAEVKAFIFSLIEPEQEKKLSVFSQSAIVIDRTKKTRGLFLNTEKANCSIYESGKMAYQCLLLSGKYDLDYLEISQTAAEIPNNYEFYIFNYHHVTMSWLNTKRVSLLPGLKATLVLETLTNNPFVLCPADDFDAYLALDPTMNVADKRVYAFPRPLEVYTSVNPYHESSIPVIGSFGFATMGKGFELVVDAVNKEFEKAIVRINIPASTYSEDRHWTLHKKHYANYLSELCNQVAKPGVKVVITNEFMTKEQLIEWCSQNTLNCFLYNRNQPGLSATTDQAISSGRPLVISTNETFRHIHRYIKPYPFQSLKESIASSIPQVKQMQKDWHPQNFATKFEEVLEDFGLLAKTERKVIQLEVKESPKETILIVSHKQKQCGIYQYGVNITEALQKSSRYSFAYAECANYAELNNAVAQTNPAAIIYNYYLATMPWLTKEVTRNYKIPQLGIMHEVTQEEADKATREMFDYHLCPDPTLIENNPLVFKTKRLISPYINSLNIPDIVTIGSFGFGFSDKGFERLVTLVQQEFDRARIVLHLPFNNVVEQEGKFAKATAENCRKLISKPGIELVINHEFLSKQQLLNFLASNTLNAFFYDAHKDRGISSVIEHALAVQRPVAINKCGMYRHVFSANPSICIEDSSLTQIINNGIAPLVPFYNEWSEASFIFNYEQILDQVLGKEQSKTPTLSLFETPIGNYYLPTDVEQDVIVNEMKAGRVFEPEIVAVAKQYIQEGYTVLDIGANFGQMTLFFSQFVGEKGRFLSFEADNFTFSVLEKNLAANRRTNIMPICKAVYDKTGEVMFYPVPDFKRFSSYGSYGLDPNAKEGRKVETIAIDSLKIQSPISFMKVDVQGSDLFVLRGAVETIRRHQMPIIFEYEEQFQAEFKTSWHDYLQFIDSIDYKIEKVINNMNYLIVPKRKKGLMVGIPNVTSFNRILDDAARSQYQSVINQLFALVPEMMARKIPEANIQQAFILDTVQKFASQFSQPKILCVGSHEDSAAGSLKKLGYQLEGIDPSINCDLNTYFHKPSTIKGSYDIIFSTSVIEHVQNDELFVTQIAELLAPGGTAILTCDYNDQYQPGDLIPAVDFRLYTQKDFNQRLLPLLKNCVLPDVPQWDCPNPDFIYEGCRYTFATFVFQKNKL